MPSRGKQLKKCAGRNLLKKNLISELSDDILVIVLSFLTMKEAGRTSVLSKRWKHVWAYIATLNFDSYKIINDMEEHTKSLEVEEPKYLYWVDQVVSLHKAPIIDEFRVLFDITAEENARNSIDNWLRFVAERRVKRLEINFSVDIKTSIKLRYTFPSLMCKSLTSLVLSWVNVTGKVIENFLCTCIGLEYLSVESSETLIELTVAGPLLSLKDLRIDGCSSLEKLEISAPNLVSLLYHGPKLILQIKSTPKLAEVSIWYCYDDDLVHSLSALSSYHSQIEALSLFPEARIDEIWMLGKDPVFSRLTKLVVTITVYYDNTCLSIGSLIKACPVLHHFKLQLDEPGRSEWPRIPEPLPHYHLKVLEIVGFVGKPIDLRIAAFLIETAVSLEKLIVDPREVFEFEYPWRFEETSSRKKRARLRARRIQENLNPDTKLEIL